VRAFARSASQQPLIHAQLTKLSGDALRAEDVAAAVQGADGVIQTLGAKASLAMFTGPIRLFSDATRILIRSMDAAGVKRLICVTGFGAGDSREHMPVLLRLPFELLLGRAYEDKAAQEMMIRRSTLSWVIARPGILTNGPSTGAIKFSIGPRTSTMLHLNFFHNLVFPGTSTMSNFTDLAMSRVESVLRPVRCLLNFLSFQAARGQ
jgi:putative NADH-flavin reductase